MPLLLVDDRDGQIVAELESEDEALAVLGAMARADEGLPEYLCLVECRSARGAVLGTDTTVKMRTLS